MDEPCDHPDQIALQSSIVIIEYGHEAKPSILGLQVVFFLLLAGMIIMVVIVVRARSYNYNYNLCGARQKL